MTNKEAYIGKSVCFTGQLNCHLNGSLISRDIAHAIAIENGMVVKKGVTKSLDMLVLADPNSQSGKAMKAREYGIKLLAETVFWRELGVQVD
jgi:DNA polymerase-3 subunit epsilon